MQPSKVREVLQPVSWLRQDNDFLCNSRCVAVALITLLAEASFVASFVI